LAPGGAAVEREIGSIISDPFETPPDAFALVQVVVGEAPFPEALRVCSARHREQIRASGVLRQFCALAGEHEIHEIIADTLLVGMARDHGVAAIIIVQAPCEMGQNVIAIIAAAPLEAVAKLFKSMTG